MPYDQYTLGSLSAEIATAMQDPTMVVWPVAEVTLAIKEALLLWGGLTSYWRERGAFQTSLRTPYYDLSQLLPTLRARTITVGQIVTQIQYHLDEAANGVSGAGMTDQFTIAQLTQAVIRARNQFVLDARQPFTVTNPGAPLTWDEATQTWDDTNQTWDQLGGSATTSPISSPPAGRTNLDNSVVAIGHMSWVASTGIITSMRREDAYSEDAFNPNWPLEPGIPFAYSDAETRPVQIQLYPPPLAQGGLELIFIKSLNLTPADDSLLAIPDEWASAIKWAALYSILSTQNEGFDPTRAKYAKARYDQIITASQQFRSVIRVQVNGKPVQLDALSNLDGVFPSWRNSAGIPNIGATIFDILALAKVPNSLYGITVDVVRSAPLPSEGNIYLQIGPEEIPYIMDYVRHVLSFKLGGGEFLATMPLYDNFISGAAQRNKLLSAQSNYLTPLFAQAAKQESIFHAA